MRLNHALSAPCRALAACLFVPALAMAQPGYTGLGGGRAQLAETAITPRFELDAVRP